MKKGRKRPMVVNFTCNKEEYDAIQAMAQKTTCRSFSEYARKMLTGKPVVTTVRNQSLDELLDVLCDIYTTLEDLVRKSFWTSREREEMQQIINSISSTVYKIIEQCIVLSN